MTKYVIFLSAFLVVACNNSSGSDTTTTDTGVVTSETGADTSEVGADTTVTASETGDSAVTTDATVATSETGDSAVNSETGDAAADTAWCTANNTQPNCICKTLDQLAASDASSSDFLNRCSTYGQKVISKAANPSCKTN